MNGRRPRPLDTLRIMLAKLRIILEAAHPLLTIADYPVPRLPRRPDEALSHHWLRHDPNTFVGFGVYPARVLVLHDRWPIILRCRADAATGWIVFGLRPDGRERMMSLFGTHRLAEGLADRYAFHWHRRRVRSKPHRR